ncbi:MAG: hypothetical protein GX442_21115, partial [Candidatus Riflebacteria bacterium]|nr:hypothetical protein [Candidatus Riflebacteria bacterium]
MGKTDPAAPPTPRQLKALRNQLRKAFAGPQAPGDPWLDGSFAAALERLVPPRRDDPLRRFLDDLWAQRPSRLPWLLRPTAGRDRARDLDWQQAMQTELERFTRRPDLLLLASEALAGLEEQARRLGEGDAVFHLRANRERLAQATREEPAPGPVTGLPLPSPGVLLVQRKARRLWLAGFQLLEPGLQRQVFGTLWYPSDREAKTAWEDALTAAHAGVDPGIRVDPVLPVLDLGGADIEGNSFGLALWLFTWLHLQRAPLPGRLAATGNVRPDGQVTAVSPATFDLKVRLALHAGYDHLFVPADNVGPASPWRGDPRVVPVTDAAQVRDWLADHDPAVRARRRVTWFLRDRTGAALPPLAPLIRRQVTGDGLPALIRDWLALARRHGTGREAFLEVLNHLRREFAGLFREGNAAPGTGPDPGELAALQAILPERVWLVFLPSLLFALARDRTGQFSAESLYQKARERFFDHDADLQMAGRVLEPLFDRAAAAPGRGDIWVQTWFRRRFPGLVWLFFHEPLEAVARLLSLPERTPDEDRALAGFFDTLAATDAARYAALDVTERDLHHHPMRQAVARHLGEFQPAIAPPPTFRERLALLWRILVRLPARPCVDGREPARRETWPPATGAVPPRTAAGSRSAPGTTRPAAGKPATQAAAEGIPRTAGGAATPAAEGPVLQSPPAAAPPAAANGKNPRLTVLAWLEAHLRAPRPYGRPPLADLFPTLLPLLRQVPTTAAAAEALAGEVKALADRPGGAVLDTLHREIRHEARRLADASRPPASAGGLAAAGRTGPAAAGAGKPPGQPPQGDLAGKVFLQALA